MNIVTAIANMEFVKIHDNFYWDEPDIEFKFSNGTPGECYNIEDFTDILNTCKRFGIAHDHLLVHFKQLEYHYNLFMKMQPEQNIPSAM